MNDKIKKKGINIRASRPLPLRDILTHVGTAAPEKEIYIILIGAVLPLINQGAIP